jgi:phenylpyruvate tautomerase PptA (4-oxalocrotonate tautomerase family)
MPLVNIQTLPISNEQKRRIGEGIVAAFHSAGIPAGSVVVAFRTEIMDLYLQDGLFFEGGGPAAGTDAAAAAGVSPASEAPAADFRHRTRRTKVELRDLKDQLVKALEDSGALSSFQAQEALGLKACDWAPAALRRFFGELEQEGAITKQGQKRGTRYVWRGLTSQPVPATVAKLVKRAEPEPED